jgi:hypothetical protein
VRISPSTAAVPPSDLPSYLIPSGSDGSASAVIFNNGFDVTKEILYGIIGDQFSRRGIACLIIDTPATGEPLRLRGVPSRPDYEVPPRRSSTYLQRVFHRRRPVSGDTRRHAVESALVNAVRTVVGLDQERRRARR